MIPLVANRFPPDAVADYERMQILKVTTTSQPNATCVGPGIKSTRYTERQCQCRI
jgi:hypothetical protein